MQTFFIEIDLSTSISGHALEFGYTDALGNLHHQPLSNATLDINDPSSRPTIAQQIDTIFQTSGTLVFGIPELDANGNVINPPERSPIVHVVVPNVSDCITMTNIRTGTEHAEQTGNFIKVV